MPFSLDKASFDRTLAATQEALLSKQNERGVWEGCLSSSALATATAVCALTLVNRTEYRRLIDDGLSWIAEHPNADGGWGDTVLCKSNISATVLCWACFGTVGGTDQRYRKVIDRAEAWLINNAKGLDPKLLIRALDERYGQDRTFSAPIISMCIITGRFRAQENPWPEVRPLPFELAILPRWLYKVLRLEVVSYALPALIAIGQSRFHFAPPMNPLTRLLRYLARKRTLRVLESIQPESGGYLEAITLTSFVMMNLTAIGLANHAVVRKGAEFLESTVRTDGSWAIDRDLSTWVTTLAVNALAIDDDFARKTSCQDRAGIQRWLIDQQTKEARHPYTGARPGGWAWTDAPGGVPDADDTAGALLALKNLALDDGRAGQAAEVGLVWLLELQNRDGGIPTFCRGWQQLPFDRSGNDLTAHALAAWQGWRSQVNTKLQHRLRKAIDRAAEYLRDTQTKDGSWPALWFGNQYPPNEQNHTYGTARVLSALVTLDEPHRESVSPMIARGTDWLIRAQNDDGGWSGALSSGCNVPSTIEETALAVTALGKLIANHDSVGHDSAGYGSADSAMPSRQKLDDSITGGVNWLIDSTQQGRNIAANPIGFYFAKLWYYEQLYPVIFLVGALQQVKKLDEREIM